MFKIQWVENVYIKNKIIFILFYRNYKKSNKKKKKQESLELQVFVCLYFDMSI